MVAIRIHGSSGRKREDGGGSVDIPVVRQKKYIWNNPSWTSRKRKNSIPAGLYIFFLSGRVIQSRGRKKKVSMYRREGEKKSPALRPTERQQDFRLFLFLF